MLKFAIVLVNDSTGRVEKVVLESASLREAVCEELSGMGGRTWGFRKIGPLAASAAEEAFQAAEDNLRLDTAGLT